MTRVIVDADALSYTAGFAAQSVVYDWAYLKDGEVVEEGITPDKSYLAFLELERPMGCEFTSMAMVEPQPVENALAMVKKSLLKIEQTMDAEEVQFKKLELFLTGKGNFRERLATIVGYKANRTAERPVHYAAIRRYMTERWGAVTVDGMEADDMLAIIAHQNGYDPDKVIIVSMDKDLMTVPGRLYNFKRQKFYHITQEQALINFYRQALTGDVVDNIKGCYKCGPKGAEEVIHPGMTELEMYEATLKEYEASLARNGCLYKEMGAEKALLENCRLLHMLRWPGQVWSPPSSAPGSSGPSGTNSEAVTCPTSQTSTITTSGSPDAIAETAEVPDIYTGKRPTSRTSVLGISGISRPRASSRRRTGNA